jgi:hypothetical protein
MLEYIYRLFRPKAIALGRVTIKNVGAGTVQIVEIRNVTTGTTRRVEFELQPGYSKTIDIGGE